MIYLALDRTHFNFRVHQAGRANDLFDHLAAGFSQLVWARSRGNIDALTDTLFELIKIQRPIVEGRGQTKSVFHQGLLSRLVAEEHAAHLWNRLVRFVDHYQGVARQVIEQRRRRLAGFLAG